MGSACLNAWLDLGGWAAGGTEPSSVCRSVRAQGRGRGGKDLLAQVKGWDESGHSPTQHSLPSGQEVRLVPCGLKSSKLPSGLNTIIPTLQIRKLRPSVLKLLRTRHCSENSTFMKSFHPHPPSPLQQVSIIIVPI